MIPMDAMGYLDGSFIKINDVGRFSITTRANGYTQQKTLKSCVLSLNVKRTHTKPRLNYEYAR